MTSRGEARDRMDLLAELRQIVQAMRNLAYAELQRAARLDAALAMARDTVLQALDTLRAMDPHALDEVPAMAPPRGAGAPTTTPAATWLVIGAERGFCGAFNARLAEQAARLRRVDPRARLLVAGRRLVELLGDDAPPVVALPGCAALDDAAPTLDAWLAALAGEPAQGRELWLLHAGAAGWVRERLLPRPPLGPDALRAAAPLHHLPPAALQGALQAQALRLLLHAALHGSLQQENHWRLAQMQRAQDHLDELGRGLRRRYATLRQADITNELETLMSALDGADGAGPRAAFASR